MYHQVKPDLYATPKIIQIEDKCRSLDYHLPGMHGSLDYLLCLSVAAAAALVQDSPASLSRQSAMVLYDPVGTSLDLRRQAVEVADRQGLLRKPSLQGLQILRLLCLLHSGTSRLPRRDGSC